MATPVGDPVKASGGPVTDQPSADPAGVTVFGRWTALDLGCAAMVFLSVSHLMFDRVSVFTPSLGVLVAAAPLGLVLLARDALGGHLPSRLALLFALSGLVSVALAPRWHGPLLGVAWGHTSWLVFVGGFAAYAIGRRVSTSGTELVALCLIASVGLSGLFAVLELIVAPETGPFRLYLGRPRGLSAHPIYLGQFAAAACAIGCWRLIRRNDAVSYALVAGATLVVALSGTRVAFATVVVFVGLTLLTMIRQPRRAVALLGTVGSALLVGWLVHGEAGASQSVVDRELAGGLGDRLELWRFGVEGWIERPVFGWGPGRFLMASQGHFDDAFAQRFADRAWSDAHNLFVELLVSWGFVGLVLFLAAAVGVARTSTGPLAWAGLAASVTWLLQPATPESLVVAGIAFGAASTSRAAVTSRAAPRWITVALVSVGMLLAALVVVGGPNDINTGPDIAFPSGMSIWYHNDWTVASRRAGIAPETPRELRAKRFWSERAIELEPEHSGNYLLLASSALFEGDLDMARDSARRALELQPSEVRALIMLHAVARAAGDVNEATAIGTQLCDSGLDRFCESD